MTDIAELDSPDPKIGGICRALIAAGRKITIRAVASELGVAHTTLSRDEARKGQIERARSLQVLAESVSRTERGHLQQGESIPLAKTRIRISELEAENALLIASHRAMIMAVGELGGMRAWRRFFEARQDALEKLEQLGALSGSNRPFAALRGGGMANGRLDAVSRAPE